MAETKTKGRRNGTRAAAKKAVPRRKVYNFDEMGGEADRPIGIINGNEYTMYASMNDMGPKRIAEFYRIQGRIDEAKGEDVEGMMSALIEVTPLIFVDEVPEDDLDSLSLGQLQKIYESFGGASEEAEATEQEEA